MSFSPTSSPNNTNNHQYPQALQLKLYQAFIFSIPILFSIILFLLFYLFYLKKRASSLSSSSQVLPTTSTQPPHFPPVCEIGLKKEIKEKLPVVLFDEALGARESQCCVCLGEFEIKQELLQIPSCNHVFHIECIHHWLHSNTTCPLCRCFVVIPPSKLDCNHPHFSYSQQLHTQHYQIASSETPQQEIESTQIIEQQQHVLPIHESSSTSSGSCSLNSVASGSPKLFGAMDNETGCSSRQELVARHIQIQ